MRKKVGKILNTESSTVHTVKITVSGAALIDAKVCGNWISKRVNKCWIPIWIAKNVLAIAQKEHASGSLSESADKVLKVEDAAYNT